MANANKRTRNFEIIVYIEQNEIFTKLQEERICYISSFHNADDNKEHCHIIVEFPEAKTITSVSKKLNIPQNQFEYIKSMPYALRYLIHLDNPNKTQYGLDAITYSGYDSRLYDKFLKAIDKKDEEGLKVLEIIEIIESNPDMNLTQISKVFAERGLWSVYRRSGAIFVQIWKENHCTSNRTMV